MSKAFSSLILTVLLLSGSQAFKIKPRIFNGIPSDRGQHPFYVFLEIDADNSNKQECGGTLVGDQFVITAAHCVDRLRDSIRLHFGVYETKNTMELGRIALTASREDIKIHPGFSRQYMIDDVAIIKLKQPIQFSQYIQSVSFSSDCNFDEFIDGVTIGSGYQSTNGQLAEHLQWAPMHTISKAECNAVFPFSSYRSEIFCVASEDYRSVCKGDSGSPLVRDFDNTFIGIASFISGDGCENGLPQAFTKVFNYQNWIADVTGLDLPHCEIDELDEMNSEFDLYC